MKKVLFVTTANLSIKPRLVKEIKLAKSLGYSAELVSFKINNWTDINHDLLVRELNIKNYFIYATRQNFFLWFISSIINNIAKKVWPYFPKNLYITAFASNKRTVMLWLFLLFKKMIKDYSLIIGRNTATIFPIIYFKKRFGGAIGFDVEDYHPGETIVDSNPKHEKIRRLFLMNKIFEISDYISFAGQPILQKCLSTFSTLQNKSTVSIRNTFPLLEFKRPMINSNEKIKLVWFSLDISKGRGLEQILKASQKLKDQVEIFLYGNLTHDFYKEYLIPHRSFIKIFPPLPQKELHSILLNYDIGLAIEPGKDLNNKLALSNKIFAYAQAGLYILATDTPAQKQFLLEDPGRGILCGQTPEEMAQALRNIIKHKEKIKQTRVKRYEKAKNMAWEKESKKLKMQWIKILENR